MISLKFQLILLWLFIETKCVDLCREKQSYQSCIESDDEKCKWDSIRRLCEITYDYQIGCSLSLNRRGCVKQIGNMLGELARCRFKTVCEVIPNFQTEQCQNNLSKFGCLSIQNREQVCYWKDGNCYLLQQNQWDQIQKDFGLQQYSASACYLIEHYLIIHSTILWDLIQYTPNLFTEADNQFKKEMGLDIDNNINYDDPNSVFLQNNYRHLNGTFVWFTYRESKTITRTNCKIQIQIKIVQISDRQREGCIALEIENDSDYLNLIRVTDEKRGINHIYCKYLNRNPSITDEYVFSDGVCKKFIKSDLNKEEKLIEFDLSCKQLDQYQCIYFDSQFKRCKIMGNEYEYPCIKLEQDYVADCENSYCTVKQCQQLQEHYIDTDTNRCSNNCSGFFLNSQNTCEAVKGCIYLGTTYIDLVKTCSPKYGCDQIGIERMYCKYLNDRCGWNEELQRCYRINDQQIKLMKCNQAFNAKSCIQITLSDQLCFWDGLECKNVLEQPILIAQRSLIDSDNPDYWYFYFRKISNINFCKYHLTIPTEYNLSEGKCYFLTSQANDLTLINRYSCIYTQPGFKKWDQQQQVCLALLEKDVAELNCNEQVLANEKICQKSKVSKSNLVCTFDKDSNSCQELDIVDIESFGCQGYGFSKEVCVSKQKSGIYCQFLGGQCKSIDESYINSILCSSLQNVNSQVCKLYSSESTVCLYDLSINSCYTPSAFTQITYDPLINRFGCQKVQDAFTYFDLDSKQCIQFNENDTIQLSNLDCNSNFVNQKTCLAIIKKGQHCYWDTNQNQCQNYSQYSLNCSDYANFTSRICQALVSDVSKQFTKDNYCTYIDNQCQSNPTILIDCGESEQMNIHRCNGLTGLNQQGEYIQMCAFINHKCTTLIEDSMDAYLLLNIIQCSQANLRACTRVQTNGNYCQLINNVSSNNFIIDKKCIQIDNMTQSCQTINTNFSKNEINPNHCSRANDSCLYDESTGCSKPTNADLECDTIGLSYLGCIQNTQNHRCAFYNQKCQYLASYQIISNCKYLNQFACSYYQFLKCYWNGNVCTTSQNYTTQYGSDYTCSLISSNQFFVSNGLTCLEEEQISNFELYTCDSPLNQFACGSIQNQYCQFIENQCQFYASTLCEDSVTQCGLNNSSDLKCVLKNGQCFHHPYTNYYCDFFEQTNYEFCRQYHDCIYVNQKCQPIYQTQNYWYCYSYPLHKCILQNKQFACTWEDDECVDFYQETCPSLEGFHSYNACTKFDNCIYGYTKSGLGFCYQDKDFDSLTCEQLSESLCLEDLHHLNSSLQCYWDESCKNIQNTSITDCQSLLNFQSSYGACIQMNQEECKYSFTDKKCKLIKEYDDSTVCQGTTLKQCSQIRNTCYFNGSNCQIKGLVEQLNKFGCLNQVGQWKFEYFKCHKIINEIQQSCINLSKEACLSDLTKELSCKWSDSKCLNTLKNENKRMISCKNLNQRACENVHLSNIRCIWNKEKKSCDVYEMIDTDCTLENIEITTSISVCSSSITKSCVRHYDKNKCTEINMKVASCNVFGLNMKGCLQQTTVPCQWIQIGDGGYCDNANLYIVKCIELLNQSACETIQTPGQTCKWEQSIQECADEVVTSCESATILHSHNACKAITVEPCYYDPFQMSCNKVFLQPNTCSNYYNSLACEISTENCIWLNNSCSYCNYYTCFQYKTESKCLNSNIINCQWLDNKCVDFKPLSVQVDCTQLPININNNACRLNSIDPCIFDSQLLQCVSNQDRSQANSWKTMSELLEHQDSNLQSSLLQGTCENLHNEINCKKSRIPNKSCIWKGSCKEVIDFSILFCTDQLNIWGCLNITNEDQQCIWRDSICQDWDQSFNVMENVNKNVCIHNSINCVYEYNSCVEKSIDEIQCQQDGVSKITCLSIPNKQCQWINSCTDFTLSNQQKCSDFQNVSIYVCQMLPNLSCGYDFDKKSCENISNETLFSGISRLACISNKNLPTYWNGQKCQELLDYIECDTPLVVNELVCILKVRNTACMYDQIKNKCTSRFNIWSLRCNSKGLNLLGCSKIEQEPCIFKDNRCQAFTEVSQICMFISLVNSKACASVLNQNCSYDSINLKCQTPLINENYCNIDGINKNFCHTNSLCLWNQDNLNCKCKSDQEVERCQLINISECKQNNRCYFDIDIQKCVKKQCHHLKEDECNSIIDYKTCYLSLKNGCQPAIKCEDIIDPKNSCQTIYINSQPCLQAGQFCVTVNNYSLSCPYSDCSNSNCIYYQGICKQKICDDYPASECQLNEGCYLDQENNCQQLLRCSQITSEIYGELVTNICNLSAVDGLKCNWQKYALLDDIEICTNQYCEMYGSSNTLCQGNEINGYSCVLFNDLICKQCESIIESCLCNSQTNTCLYQNGKCNSILCSSFLTKQACLQAQDRCYWSINSQENIEICVKQCEKIIDQNECNSRFNECYFENQNGLCVKGQKQIPNLSSDIIIEEFYAVFISQYIYLIFIIFI